MEGMTVLTLSASIHGLKPPCDDNNTCRPKGIQIATFYLGLYLIALGTGGIKPCVSLFGADQFDDTDETEKKEKDFFLLVNTSTKLYRNQKPGGSPLTRIFQVIVASFRKFKVKVPRDGSVLFETGDEESAVQGSRKLNHTEQLSFFDKAAVETQSDRIKGSINPWSFCTVTQVEELKSIIRLLPIWATGIIFSSV
ncbi:hypothetical protein RND71_038593 [Anisodus tanguticus]|uniref:Uncharacterized protein n=1 Tax=Anisodus tanguticus TaxID=243964 RepID=A0AAE1R2I4_9SOLA|nr:hypothetical protein RND71_038593 [Anisodus tanguticus]